MAIADACAAVGRFFGEDVAAAESLGGGKNSQVFKVVTSHRTVVVKRYFRAKDDPRDRLKTECQALRFLAAKGTFRIPEVLHVDQTAGVAIMSFAEGRRICDDEMTAGDQQDVIDFVRQLKEAPKDSDAAAFNAASEAFFSLKGVLGNLETRLERLRRRPSEAPLGDALNAFLEARFTPAMVDLSSRANVYYRRLGLTKTDEVDPAFRVLSPSDFGLHNCIKSEKGLIFLDMEYFGWDDPAKLIADFVLHPAQGVVGDSRYSVAKRLVGVFDGCDGFRNRLAALLPLFALKWCMIILNEFLAGENARRVFSGSAEDHEPTLERQLELAATMLETALSGEVAERLAI